MKHGNVPEKKRPLLFLQNNPGWHDVKEIALLCRMTSIEVGLALRGTTVEKECRKVSYTVCGYGEYCYYVETCTFYKIKG